MNISIEEVSPTRKELKVKIPREDIAGEEKSIIKEFCQKAKMPGFRAGKAPEGMIRKRFAKEISEDLQRRLEQKAYEYVYDNAGLELYAIKEMRNEGFEGEGEGVVTLEVDIREKFELPEYKGIQVKVEKAEVAQDEIDKAVDHIRDQHAEYEVKEEPAEAGDYVKLDYLGSVDGTPIAEIAPDKPIYGEQKATWEEAGAEENMGVRAVVEGLVGMKPGEEKTVEMEFPSDFEVPALAGRKASYEIKVLEVRKKIRAELDEALLKKIGVETEEQLRDKIKGEFERNKENRGISQGKDQIVKHLMEQVSFSIPESAVEHEVDGVLRSFMTRMMGQGVAYDELEQNKEQLVADARKVAEERVRTNFILEEIGKKESIELKDDEVNQFFMQEAMMAGMRPEELVRELKKDRQRVIQIKRNALVNKVLDFLHKEAKVEYIEPEAKKA